MEMNQIRNGCLKYNKRIQKAIKTILEEIGDDPKREGLERTPFRFAKACEEWFGGYGKDPDQILNREFTENSDLVIEGPIKFFSHCEHHVAPFFGEIWISYVPKKSVTGLDKMVKLVEIFARRLQVQERMTKQIADAMFENLKCKGVMVVCKAYHLCVSGRETRNPSTYTITSAIRGIFKQKDLRDETLQLMRLGQ